MTITTYKQHVFTQDGTFTVAHTPLAGYFDIIIVGGGSSGHAAEWYWNDRVIYGGAGGQVVYKRVYINSPRNYSVIVGQGGYLSNGTESQVSDIATAAGGTYNSSTSTIYTNQNLNGYQGTLITDGLFSDNTTYYGGGGASIGAGDVGQPGAGGGSTVFVGFSGGAAYGPQLYGQPGQPNTGGGGGAARHAGLDRGGSGVVIIRYPILT